MLISHDPDMTHKKWQLGHLNQYSYFRFVNSCQVNAEIGLNNKLNSSISQLR